MNLLAQLSPPTRLGSRYRELIARSHNISAYLNANVTEIETPGDGESVAAVHGCSIGGRKFLVRAHRYVLATGGIETPRLLLASNRHQPNGVGNNHDVVGRYFMDHPRLLMGEIIFRHPERNSRIYDMHHRGARKSGESGVRLSGFFGLTADAQREEGILNARCCVKSQFLGGGYKATVASITLLRTICERRPLLDRSKTDLWNLVSHLPQIGLLGIGLAFNPKFLHRAFALETVIEPTPQPNSRVTLTNQRDALGVPLPQLDWKLGDLEKRTIRRTQEILRDELGARGEAVLMVNAPDEDQPWPEELTGCWHHMGTARMHDDPRKGVADRNCRVHGVANLFVAGGAVLPTAGSDMPTLTIVALAVRLAGRLKTLYGLWT